MPAPVTSNHVYNWDLSSTLIEIVSNSNTAIESSEPVTPWTLLKTSFTPTSRFSRRCSTNMPTSLFENKENTQNPSFSLVCRRQKSLQTDPHNRHFVGFTKLPPPPPWAELGVHETITNNFNKNCTIAWSSTTHTESQKKVKVYLCPGSRFSLK